MSSKKISTFDLIKLPQQFGVVLLTFSLILLLSPYLEGADMGIFKVPVFKAATKQFLQYFGPIIFVFIITLFIPIWKSEKREKIEMHSVESQSKYRIQSIPDIVKNEARKHGINIDGISIGDRLTIHDLERICTKTYFPNEPHDSVCRVLQNARGFAFTQKYAEPKEDEKLVDVSQIKLQGLQSWDSYFRELTKDLGIEDITKLDVLDVGIGNGHASEKLFSSLHSFKAVDISYEALQYARRKYPQMIYHINVAEDLKDIPNSSIDLYLSFRTYQSTLFNRRIALHEAYRVLKNGGVIITSIPIMFLKTNGDVLSGLIPPGSYIPDMEYAKGIVTRIQEYMEILNFENVGTDNRSPYEIYVYGQR